MSMGYDIGYVIGLSIPLVIIVGVLALTVWGIRSIFLGAVIIRATDVQIKRAKQLSKESATTRRG